MNGATTEPCASTSSPPSSTVTTMIGSSQNLRRAPRKRHICITKSIARSLSEHVLEAVVRRPGRVAVHPVGGSRGLPAPLHRVAPGLAHEVADRGEDGEED